jgi:hypothetical protein
MGAKPANTEIVKVAYEAINRSSKRLLLISCRATLPPKGM